MFELASHFFYYCKQSINHHQYWLINLGFMFFIFNFLVAAAAQAQSYPIISEDQGYLKQIGVEQAWQVTRGRGVIVAVLDSGVDVNNPYLKGNIWNNAGEIAGDNIDNDHNGYVDDVNGWDFVTNTNNPLPKLDSGYVSQGINHGTAVSGIIAAPYNYGLTGLAPEAKIMPLRILSGNGEGDLDNLINAVHYAINNGANIINLSLVGPDKDPVMEAILKDANNQGVIIITAAGNTASSIGGQNLNEVPLYPICYQYNLGATSVGLSDKKSVFANYGSNCVKLSAPGENIKSLAYYDPADGFKSYYRNDYNGTSFASAVTAGAAALLKSKNQLWRPWQVIRALTETATDINSLNPNYYGQLGSGRLDVGAAMNFSFPQTLGYLVKLAKSPAVYYVDSTNHRHLFVNESTFYSWYTGPWSDQGVRIISQVDFNELDRGSNIALRAGSLARIDNSQRVYAVSSNNRLCQITNATTSAYLYGDKWPGKILTIQAAFENDYLVDPSCQLTVDSLFPDGALIQYQNSADLWYIDGGLKRLVTSQGFIDNNFKSSAIIKSVSSAISFASGRSLSSWEEQIFPYIK